MAVHELISRYTHQSQVLSLFYRWLVDQSSWCLPVLYMLLTELRELAEQVCYTPLSPHVRYPGHPELVADVQADSITYASTGKMPALEECTRTVSKAFTICTTDRCVTHQLRSCQVVWI